MTRALITLLASVAAIAGLSTAPAQQPALTHAEQVIGQAGAEQVMKAAEAQALALHAPCAIAVVDRSGILIAFVRMDGTRPGSPDLAIGKARTAALLQRPSAETEENTNNGRTAFVTSGFMALRGGVPLLAHGEIVGAVGVAGLNKDNDVRIAEAATAAFAAQAAAQPADQSIAQPSH